MKVYLLKSKTSLYAHSDLLVTDEFYLVPIINTNNFDVYLKDIFTLTVVDATPMEKIKCPTIE